MRRSILWSLQLLVAARVAARAAVPRLAEGAREARYAPACAPQVPLNHYQTFPVPVRGEKGLRYRVLFYPARSKDGEAARDQKVLAPSNLAEFDPDGSKVKCRVRVVLPRHDSAEPLGPMRSKRAAHLAPAEWNAKESELYAALQRSAEAFIAGRRDPDARASAREFLNRFELLSEPALEKHYRAMSPDFWEWVEAAARP